MKKIVLIFTVVIFPLIGFSQVKIEKPASSQATSFAIVIDQQTYDKTREAVHLYRDALEQDGLSTYIISDQWKTPEQVRHQLKTLYKQQPNLEGIVMIGDIPIVLVRNAQHMTTAFKMNEDSYARERSSVTSDRYYDDLDLTFDFIAQDTVNTLCFYYNLSPNSPQKLDPTYYSGRILYPSGKEGDKYAEINKFLRKAVAEKQRAKQIDHIVTFIGHGYNSDCLTAWMDEKIAINENFPLTGKDHLSAKHLNFRMDEFMKYRLFDEISRDEVDLMFFNEHGSIDLQHISGGNPLNTSAERLSRLKSEVNWYVDKEAKKENPDVEGAKKHFMKEYGLTPSFFNEAETEEEEETGPTYRDSTQISLEDLTKIKTMPRFVMFNACYNGSFQTPGCIAAYYIFNDGRTVATQGNTVNVLQDRWTYEMVGLLSHGVRIGQYNRLVATLEGHIIGDPTFRYKPIEPNTLSADMVTHRNDNAVWEEYLKSNYADVRSIAARMLVESKTPISSQRLLAIMKDAPHATTRLQCLKLLSNYRNDDFNRAIIIELNDSYEQARRQAANYAWMSGDPMLLPAVTAAYVNDPESERVKYTLSKVLSLSSKDKVIEAMNQAIDNSTYLDKDSKRKQLIEKIEKEAEYNQKGLEIIKDKKEDKDYRQSTIRSVRNNTYHQNVNDYLALVADNTEDLDIRLIMAEALGWFRCSIRNAEIIAGCKKIIAENPNLAPALKNELNQTIIRLN